MLGRERVSHGGGIADRGCAPGLPVGGDRFNRIREGLKLSQSRISKLGELPDLAGFLLKSDLGLTPEAFAKVKSTPEEILEVLNQVADILRGKA